MLYLLMFIVIGFVVVLGALAVDRINFPQKPFKYKQAPKDAQTDSYGAHLSEE